MTKTYNILAVEDEPDHLLALEIIFQDVKGFKLFSAKDTQEAQFILNNNDIDIVILDLALPLEDGTVFCRRIKADPAFKDLPILALSAFPHEFYKDKALSAGCVDFIEKPFEAGDLVEKIRKYVGQHPRET